MTPPPPSAGQAADRRVLLQCGFGDGHAFLQAWQAWRQDASRAAQLDFIAVTLTPPSAPRLREAHDGTTLQALAFELAAQWPPPTRNLHRLDFDGGHVRLLLAIGAALDWLPELRAQVDHFLIDELDAAADPRAGVLRICKSLAQLAAPQARLQANLPMRDLQPALRSAGFHVDASGGHDAAAGTAVGGAATYSPNFVPRLRTRPVAEPRERLACIVGAGLAGCAAACALAEQGWHSTLLDRHEAPAQEGSGNPAGLFHGIVNAQDGAHARFNRAAALQAHRAVRLAIEAHGAKGGLNGLLRLQSAGDDVAAMRAVLAALQLPPDYVQALDAVQASALCGVRLQHPAWFYPGGGWVQPAALARSFLLRAGTCVRFRGSLEVHSLEPVKDGWLLRDGAGRIIERTATVVLANATDALRLLGRSRWPAERVRGQVSLYRNGDGGPTRLMRLPRLPLAGAGYLLPEVDGVAVFGASSQPGDADPDARQADHVLNLERVRQLSPQTLPGPAAHFAGLLQGRVGWRCVASDRLPLVGAVPDESALARLRVDALRDVPHRRGLYVFSALASRGIAWAALGGQVLAAQISGAPVPLEASLVDAVDPARFALRARRRRQTPAA